MKKNKDVLTIQQRADNVIAQSCTTYSKRYDQYIEGVYPTHVYAEIDATSIACVDSEDRFIDFGGLGANLFDSKNNYSLPCIEEVLLAEEIVKRIKCIEKLKFLKTGSAACEMAVRFARAFTGKRMVWFQGYHGTHDTFISHEIPGVGCVGKEYSRKFDTIPEMIKEMKFQIKKRGDCFLNDLPGSIIIEPVILDDSKLHIKNLKTLVELCKKMRILVIFDEIVTGFRYLDYTVSNHYKFEPDLICLGKALGNGYPLSILGGRKDIMDNPDVFCSNTHNGEKMALSEALKNIEKLNPVLIDLFFSKCNLAKTKFNTYCMSTKTTLRLKGIATRWTLTGDEKEIALFFQEMLYKNWIIGKSMFPKIGWYKYVYDRFLFESKDCIDRIVKGKVKLKGKLPRHVFKRY
jgi:glutamate-1-semialdehyde 2,1-aminomutase